jgi:hypothetical protein
MQQITKRRRGSQRVVAGERARLLPAPSWLPIAYPLSYLLSYPLRAMRVAKTGLKSGIIGTLAEG